MTDRYKAIELFSGGLDSILSARIMVEEGFEVIALHFYTGFNGSLACDIARGHKTKWTPEKCVVDTARNLGIRLLPMDVSMEYLDIMLTPRYGYGSAVNPCIDCRIFLLEKARKVMETEGAIFVFTGEVLGQRPMSQHKNALRLVEKRSGLEGRLLRPLSAKLLDITILEKEGIINRDHLYDIHGRSRKPQQELARRFGIDGYPNPGGGCILTDKFFGKKFHDLICHLDKQKITLTDITSLKTGRHIRLISGKKVIVGRSEVENNFLMKLLAPKVWYFESRDFQGASVFALDHLDDEDFLEISAITARYGKGNHEDSVVVIAQRGNELREFSVKPAKQESIISLQIC